mgnify:FL=1
MPIVDIVERAEVPEGERGVYKRRTDVDQWLASVPPEGKTALRIAFETKKDAGRLLVILGGRRKLRSWDKNIKFCLRGPAVFLWREGQGQGACQPPSKIEEEKSHPEKNCAWLTERREQGAPSYVAAERQDLKAEMQEAIATYLEPREQRVMRLRFGLEDGRSRTLEEVGRELGVTRERIRQIEAKALRKLRRPSCRRLLEDFLGT